MEISLDCSDHAVKKQRDLLRKSGDDDMEDASAAAQLADNCFSCNICLDFVIEPVVTLCGHLYCSPCIYTWMQVESVAARQCPVCKVPLVQNTLVRLYGIGDRRSTKEAEPEIPRRSPLPHRAMIDTVFTPWSSSGVDQERRDAGHPINERVRPPPWLHHHHADYYTGYVPASPIFRSMAGGVLGNLAAVIFPWAFSGQEASMLHACPRVAGQRQLQMESCLNQLWSFLFYFVLLCLLFF